MFARRTRRRRAHTGRLLGWRDGHGRRAPRRGRRPARRPRSPRASCSCTRVSDRWGCGAASRRPCARRPAGVSSPSRASATAARTRLVPRARRPSSTRRPQDVLPALLAALDAPEPVLVGHSDGASIALVHAARHPVTGLALLAPHVFVEEVTVEAIRATHREFEAGELRARMARHHDDPDAAFFGWCDVWLDPGLPRLDARAGRAGGHGARAAHPGRRRPLRQPGATRPHRGARARAGAAAGGPGRPQPASGAA